MIHLPTSRVIALAIAALFFPALLAAHEGHDHDAPPPPPAVAAAPRAEASSELFELVAIADGAELTIYVDRFRGNDPVVDAVVEVETPDGPQRAMPAGDTYRLAAPWLARPGRHELIFSVSAGVDVDVLTATLTIAEPVPAAPASDARGFIGRAVAALRAIADHASAERYRGVPTIALGAAGGFLAGALSMPLLRRRRRAVIAAALLVLIAGAIGSAAAHEGHDHGDDAKPLPSRAVAQRLVDGAVFVPKPTQRILAIRSAMTESGTHPISVELPGRVIPDPNASGYVQASIAGRLSPPPGGFPRLGASVKAGDVLAFVQPPLTAAEASDQRQRQGELDQQISIVQRRIARFAELDRSGAVARVQLDEARLELQGLRDRRAALDRVRRDAESLVAPVDGRIAAANAVAGQIADTSAVIFHIVDPRLLWVEALALTPVPAIGRAWARDAAGRVLALAYEGTGLADRGQAIPIHLRIAGGAPGLRLGQLMTVLLETQEAHLGIVIPRASVLRGANGQAIVYEHVAAERFEPREVRVQPLDGARALVVAGLERGRRVVTQGAELLNQIR